MEKLSEKKSKWQMGVSSTLQGGRGGEECGCSLVKGRGRGSGGVASSRACPAIAIQIAATNAISIGFGQQVGAKRGKGYTNHHQLVSLVNVYQTVRQL